MAEFLILNKPHWTEALTEEQKAKWTDHEVDKFAAVNQKWDIIEAQENNKWPTRPDFNPAFCVIRVPDMPLEEARTYTTNWKRKLTVQETIVDIDKEWHLDVTVVQESVSGLENLVYQREFKTYPEATEIATITNGKRYLYKPTVLTTSVKDKDMTKAHTEDGTGLLKKKIKKHRYRFVALSQYETLTVKQFVKRVVDKLTLTENEING